MNAHEDGIEEGMIIPEDLADNELLCYLYARTFNDSFERDTAKLLHRICYASLTDLDKPESIKMINLSNEDHETILNNHWDKSANMEVKARCNDVLSRFEKDKRNSKIIASESYLVAFQKHEDIEFLIRSITIRDFKSINTDAFLEEVMSAIYESFDHPFWIQKVVKSLKRSFPVEKLKDLSDYIESEKNQSKDNNRYGEEREYLQSQRLLNTITEYEFHKEMALSFEKEADTTVNNKKENTYYPNLVEDYQDAYNEIFQIKKQEPEIFERIKKKLLQEKSVFMEMLSCCGFKSKIEVPEDFIKSVDENISSTNISNFIQTINLMLSIPFVNMKEVNGYESATKRASITQSMFSHTQLDANGNKVGHASPQEGLRIEAHVYFRQKRLYIISRYIHLHQCAKIKSSEDFVYYFLSEKKPIYIEEDNLIFWTKGINAGLSGDFITASYVLMPQLEHALHNIAEIKNGNITTLEKKRQLSPTLGSILPKLKDVFKEEVYFEINSFLQGETDVNFRNNLLHGLFTPFEVEKYGRYLWWICIKIYFEEIIM
ncbi:MAG: DUF4209 domain-containing protein [Bacteroidia bacterium 43-41]|nr:MAG: DUF4209 domain-containing protein [Bacteroidia bacterium 43-41]